MKVLLALFILFYSFGTVNCVKEIFVVAHSHDDVGWIITPDQYFDSEVQYIYDTVVQALLEDSSRKFIFVEVAYLRMWYLQASPQQQTQVKQLFDNGQIEFVIGGIVMNDEAASHYESIINQLQVGHQFLLDTFGPSAIPKIGWQIDPFGASIGTPTLFAYDCFDALVISRIDYLEKRRRELTKEMEFIWHGTTNLGLKSDMFTHLLDYKSYCTTETFAFGDYWDIYDSRVNPNPPITNDNLKLRADELVLDLKERASFFATDNFLFPFGCDFNYQNAGVMFKNMDKLMNYINNNTATYGVHLQYATLSDYFDTVNQVNYNWPEYSSDFFPYNDDAVSFWTGYYTSRNELKIKSRQADGLLRSADILTTLTRTESQINTHQTYSALENLRLQSAIAQHHDAISGTARKVVVDDYIQNLDTGVHEVESIVPPLMQQQLLNNHTTSTPPTITLDHNFLSHLTSGTTAPVILYNSLGRIRYEYVHIKIPAGVLVDVYDNEGTIIKAQQNVEIGDSQYEHLYFETTLLQVGFKTYYLKPVSTSTTTVRSTTIIQPVGKSFTISNDYIQLYFNTSLQLSNISVAGLFNTPIPFNQNLLQYNVSTNITQPGGAYIFRNDGPANPLPATAYFVYVNKGPLVQSVELVYNLSVTIDALHVFTNSSNKMTLYKSNNYIVRSFVEVGHGVGPLNGNKDFIVRYNIPSMQNNQKIWQDDSGLLTLERTYDPTKSLVTPGNYYPMVSTAFIQDNISRFTVISANAHGCSTQPENGVLEVMLHRRTLQDDYRGLGEPLNDYDRIHVHHRITLDNPTQSENYRHEHRLLLNNPIVQFYSVTNNATAWSESYTTEFSALINEIPQQLHLISLQILNGNSNSTEVIMRLQNLFQSDSLSTFVGPANVNLNSFFTSQFSISNIVHRTLSGNRPLSQCSRLQWTGGVTTEPFTSKLADPSNLTILPSEIATVSFSLA